MRELKFRAWDSADKMMYHNIQDGIKFDDGSCYSFDKFLRNSVGDPDMEDYHRWSIMQYTGLKDARGAEIYEGDILSFVPVDSKNFGNPYKPFVVFWDEKDARFSDWSPRDKVEIIGNIYENPELME